MLDRKQSERRWNDVKVGGTREAEKYLSIKERQLQSRMWLWECFSLGLSRKLVSGTKACVQTVYFWLVLCNARE